MNFINPQDKIYVAGSGGMVGSALIRLLKKNGFTHENNNLITIPRNSLDLRNSDEVKSWFKKNKPTVVIIAAAKVGGIMANKNYPVEFLLDNLKIQNNLIESSYQFSVKRLLFLGSSCIYPKFSPQPIKEKHLLTGSLEKTNQWYAIAKIGGLKLCQAYKEQYGLDAISIMPTNLYGKNDNYNYDNSHVMAALIRRFYDAKMQSKKKVICWGTGSPMREFLYVDDLAEACFFILKNWSAEEKQSPIDNDGEIINWINVGSEFEISIKDLANKIADNFNYKGKIVWDEDKPDGTPRKKLDTSFLDHLGWEAKTNLDIGISNTINFFKEEYYNLN